MLPLLFWLFGRRAALKVAALAGALALAGCAPAREEAKLLKLVWPEPPLTTRIEFVRNVGSERDLGRESSATENILEFLTGSKPPIWHLAEPMGLAVSDDGSRLYVSDFGQLAVYVFDFQTKKVTIWGQDKPFKLKLTLSWKDTNGNKYVYVGFYDLKSAPRPDGNYMLYFQPVSTYDSVKDGQIAWDYAKQELK